MDAEPLYIVTGATGGIGRAIVRQLAARGKSTIVLAVRRPEATAAMVSELEAPTGCHLLPMALDLASTASVEKFAENVLKMARPIDGLINNAGIMPGKIIMTHDGYESATQVNYASTRRLTELLAPAMRPGGAIVFTTSVTRKIARIRPDWASHALNFHGFGRRFITYGRSKRMIAAWGASLGRTLAPKAIRVNCSDPGIVDSGMITMGIKAVDRLADLLFRPLIYTPDQGAAAALRAFDAPTSGHIYTLKGKTKNDLVCPEYLL